MVFCQPKSTSENWLDIRSLQMGLYDDGNAWSRLSTKDTRADDSSRLLAKDKVDDALCRAIADLDIAVTVAFPDFSPNLMMCSAGFEVMTEYRCKELVGTQCRCLGNCEDEPEEKLRLQLASTTGQPTSVVLTNMKKSGEMFRNCTHIRGIVVGTDSLTDKEVWYLIGFHGDDTEQPDMESNLDEMVKAVHRQITLRLNELDGDIKYYDTDADSDDDVDLDLDLVLGKRVDIYAEPRWIQDGDVKCRGLQEETCRVPPPCDMERDTYILSQLAAVFTVPSFLKLCSSL